MIILMLITNNHTNNENNVTKIGKLSKRKTDYRQGAEERKKTKEIDD